MPATNEYPLFKSPGPHPSFPCLGMEISVSGGGGQRLGPPGALRSQDGQCRRGFGLHASLSTLNEWGS